MEQDRSWEDEISDFFADENDTPSLTPIRQRPRSHKVSERIVAIERAIKSDNWLEARRLASQDDTFLEI